MARRLDEALTALVWLTRLPLAGRINEPMPALSAAVWAFPLSGLAVALPGGAVLLLALWIGLPATVAAILAVGVPVLLTGGLHEDGLADYADGCGGTTRERRLEIMRDSRIGTYGVLALGFVVMLRVALLAALAGQGAMLAAGGMLAAAALSRTGMGAALALMPPARPDGLGRAAGRPSSGQAGMAATLAIAVLAVVVIWANLPLAAAAFSVVACMVGQVALARHARQKLGGQTGDVLGAIQQVGEVATLLALLAAL